MIKNDNIIVENFKAEVDFDKSIENLTKKYAHISLAVNSKNFPRIQEGKKTVSLKLLSLPIFTDLTGTKEILHAIYGLQLFPADIFSVLNFCNNCLFDYECVIAAPYSVCREYLLHKKSVYFSIPYVAIDKKGQKIIKSIDLHDFNSKWNTANVKFAAIDFGLSKLEK